MARDGVRSFGDGLGPLEGDGDLEPPQPPAASGVPRIALMLEPVLDEDALESVVARVREAIAEAVRDGFRDAVSDALELVEVGNTPPAPVEVPFDCFPAVDSRDRFAMQKYAERLDREHPGWWWTDVEMAPDLMKLAQMRRGRVQTPESGGR